MTVGRPDLERLIDLKASKAIDELEQRFNKEQKAVLKQSPSSRGALDGGTAKKLVRLAIGRLGSIARVSFDTFKQTYSAAGLLTPQSLRERGGLCANRFLAVEIETRVYVTALKDRQPGPFQEAIDRLITGELEKLKSDFLRDVEIDASELEYTPGSPSATTSAAQAEEFDVFLSFASPDVAAAESIYVSLTNKGLRVFFSPKDLQGGDPWEEKIRSALVGAHEICVLASTASIDRQWVLTEWGAAWATQKRITPVLVNCSIEDLPPRLQSKQCIPIDQMEAFAVEAFERRKVRKG